MSIEVRLDWGDDFVLDSTGDLQVHVDADGTYPALTQRIIQMVLCAAQIIDDSGNAVPNSPDDMFYPNNGVSGRRLIGARATDAKIAEIEANIIAGLATEPEVASFPPPDLEFVVYPDGVILNMSVPLLVTGQMLPLPPIPLTQSGA